MLDELCQYLRNWFDIGRFFGTFTISDGALSGGLTANYVLRSYVWTDAQKAVMAGGNYSFSDILKEGQYFRIVGSNLNDGVYQYPATKLKDESFDGALWVMAVPPSVITLSDEIKAWQTKYAAAASSPFSVESVTSSSYSRTKATGDGLGSVTWQKAFSARLAPWRKL